MIEPAPLTPEGTRRAPAEMSVAEKLACEWEARHDVAARGRSVSPAPVQNYLTHVRCEDVRHPAPPPHPHPVASQPDFDQPYVLLPLLRGWVTWEKLGR
jgi:hypothetical protein